MKKLMTMIAAVATAFGLYAADTGTSFERATEGATLNASVNGIGELPHKDVTNVNFWAGLDTEGQTQLIKKFNGDAPTSGRPDQFAGDDENTRYLELSSGTSVLERYVKAGGEDTFDVADGNLFFDSMVNMTAFEDAPTIPADAKIAVWLQEELNEETQDPVATNLMITVGGGEDAVSYTADGDNSSLLENWARVTVKALPLGNDKIGFVVFVKGKMVTCSTLTYDMTGYTDNAKQYAGMKALFPFTGTDTTIKSAGFAGKGSIDDLVFTETVPNITNADDFEFFTLRWDETTVESVVGLASNPTNLLVDGEAWDYTYVAQSGYISGSTNITGVAGQTYTITAAKLGASVYKFVENEWKLVEGGQVSTFADALALVDNTGKFKIELGQDEGAITIDKAGCDLTLDLAGKKIESKSDEVSAIAVNAGKLTIIDSDGNGVVQGVDLQDGSFSSALALPEEPVEGTVSLAINGGTFYGSIDYTTEDNTTIALNGAKFDAGSNTDPQDESSCLVGGNIGEGNEWVLADDFWSVQEITVTEVDLPTAVEYTYDATAKTPYEGTDKYTVTGQMTGTDADSYTVTFALKDKVHNKWTGKDTAENQSVTWTIAPAAVTVTPRAGQTKVYSGNSATDPAFMYDVTLLGTDELEGALAREEGEDVGEYAFNIGTLANDNYELTLADNAPKFTITALALTDVKVTLNPTEADLDAGKTTPDAYTTVTVASDSATLDPEKDFEKAWDKTTVDAAGDYVVTISSKAGSNYTFDSVKATLVIKSAEPEPEPVEPGKDIKTGKTPAEINADPTLKAELLKAPEDAVVNPAVYNTYFDAAPGSEAGTVKFVLNATGEAALKNNVDGEIVKIKPDKIADGTADSVSITPIAGFYYAIKQGDGIGTMKVLGEGVLAKSGEALTLPLTKFDGAGFYKVIVSEKAILPEN